MPQLKRPLTQEHRLFLRSWLDWLEAGAPHGNPYSREHGLCHAHLIWKKQNTSQPKHYDLYDMFDPVYPFAPRGELNTHCNAARIAFAAGNASPKGE